MFQIPSIDWPRRSLVLDGTEDLLKQNPIGDSSPQEERIPTALLADYVVGLINLNSNGSGKSIIKSKSGFNFDFKSLAAASSKIELTTNSNHVYFDVDPIAVANSINLSDLLDVVDSPSTNEFLYYNGSTWVTTPMLTDFYLTDANSNLTQLSITQNTITFVTNPNIAFQTSIGNYVEAIWSANLTDLSDVPTPSNSNQYLVWNGTNFVWQNISNLSSGSVADAVNIGSGVGVYSNKVGNTLRFRSLVEGSSKTNITLNGSEIEFDVDPTLIANEINLTDLLDVFGSPSNGSLIQYNSSNTRWEVVSGLSVGMALQVQDEDGTTNSFNSSTPIRIYGGNNIITNFTSSTELKIDWIANLTDLTDVDTSNLGHNYTLVYNASGSTWQSKPLSFNLLGNTGSQIVYNNESMRILGQNGIVVNVTNPDTALVRLNASLFNLNDVPSPTNINQVLQWIGGGILQWVDISTLGGGEANNGSNVGTLGYGVFKQKSGTTLQFRNIASGSSKISTTLDTSNNILIDAVPLEIAEEIRLQDLMDVTNNPTSGQYLMLSGTTWITSAVSPSVSITVEADTGANNTIINNDTYILAGDEQFIITENEPSKTKVTLDINAVADAIDIEDLGNVFGNPEVDDVLVYNGTNFIFQPFPSTSFSDAWMLDGNSETSEKSFGTLNNQDIPILVNNILVAKFKVGGSIGFGTATPNSKFEVNGSIGLGNVTTKTANYTASSTDYMILVNASGGNVTITLPSAIDLYRREYVVKKIDSSPNIVYVTSVVNIDNVSSYEIESHNVAIKLKSDDVQWWVY